MRRGIIQDTHNGLAHCGHENLIEALQVLYWWPGMRSQVSQVLRNCPIC